MAKKKGKLFLNKNQSGDIQGFEEIIDLLDKDNIEYLENESRFDSYEAYDFLSNEILRLKKLDSLERVTLPAIENDDQNAMICQNLEFEIDQIQSELVLFLSKENSPFMEELDRIWKSFFP